VVFTFPAIFLNKKYSQPMPNIATTLSKHLDDWSGISSAHVNNHLNPLPVLI
jgi:hypothetical protein